jgi:hypothetical protein
LEFRFAAGFQKSLCHKLIIHCSADQTYGQVQIWSALQWKTLWSYRPPRRSRNERHTGNDNDPFYQQSEKDVFWLLVKWIIVVWTLTWDIILRKMIPIVFNFFEFHTRAHETDLRDGRSDLEEEPLHDVSYQRVEVD